MGGTLGRLGDLGQHVLPTSACQSLPAFWTHLSVGFLVEMPSQTKGTPLMAPRHPEQASAHHRCSMTVVTSYQQWEDSTNCPKPARGSQSVQMNWVPGLVSPGPGEAVINLIFNGVGYSNENRIR